MESVKNDFKLTLKFTDGTLLVVDVEPTTTIEQMKAVVQAQSDAPFEKIKLVYKGKMTADGETMKSLGISKPSTIIVVINKFEKVKPTQQPKQSIPTNFQTGLGDFNPVGFGNYGIMNHPQYMSTLSGLNEDKIEEMMDDPFYESMIEELLKDPDTMVKMMQDNPVTKKMMDSNPMMKMMMSNPATLKMILSPENMKMIKQMKKNGGGLGGLGGMGGLGGLGGSVPGATGATATMPGLANPMGGFGWPGAGMMPNLPPVPNTMGTTGQGSQLPPNPMQNMGMGFGMNPFSGGYNPYYGMGYNPFMMGMPMLNPMMPNAAGSAAGSPVPPNPPKPTQSKESPTATVEQPSDEVLYASQIKQLEDMGFTDRQKIISALRKANGKLQDAVDFLDE